MDTINGQLPMITQPENTEFCLFQYRPYKHSNQEVETRLLNVSSEVCTVYHVKESEIPECLRMRSPKVPSAISKL